jgi:hypothetical protein
VKRKNKFAMRNGERIGVARPENPALALSIGREAQLNNDPDLLDSVFEKCGPYTFVGYLARAGESILDEKGEEIDVLRPGDSMIDPRGFEPMAKA